VGNREFDRIAELVIPGSPGVARSLEPWLGQVVLRIGGIADGIGQVYPGENDVVKSMSNVLRNRYDAVMARSTIDPRDQPIVRVDPRSDGSAARKLAIMRELDGILGDISVLRVDAAEAARRLIETIQNVHDLVEAERIAGVN
jgi:hypothetical protein